jgi:LCP family protein required for cell wall assembly
VSDRRRVSPRDQTPPSGDQKVWSDPRGGRDHFGQDSHGFGADSFRDDSYGGFFGDDAHGADSFGADSFRQPPHDAPRGQRSGVRAGDAPTGRDAYDDLYEDEAPKRRRRRGGGDEDELASVGAGARSGRARGRGRGGDSAEPALATGYGAGGGRGFEPPDDKPGDGAKRSLGVVGWVSIVLTSVLVLGTLAAYKVYRDTFGLIKRGASTDDLDKNRPVNQTGAINVLLVGSDTRAGDNARYGKGLVNDGERTDTIMLLHVAPNRDGATLVSFPRDSMVQIPQCRNTQTKAIAPTHLGMINSAFSDGGMICTRRTIETLTGIPIDHYVKVDFTGFKNIVNALDGIEICVPRDVDDKDAKLHLKAGKQTVKGETALAYVRARHALGNGSDIDRIKRQQIFISQVVKKATSSALLTDIGKLTAFIQATAESVTMDDKLNASELIQIAQSAQKLSAKGFKATTVPWEPYTPDPNRVQWKQPDANNLFNAIKGDTVVASPTPTPAKTTATTGGTGTGTTGGTTDKPAATPITRPQQVRVAVYNGTNTGGKGKEVADELTAQGFKVVSIGNATKADGTDQPKTMVRYEGVGAASTKILTAKLLNEVAPEIGKVTANGPSDKYTPSTPPPGPKAKASGPTIQLVVGADWKGIRIPLKVGDDAVTSKTNICAG